MNCHFLNTCDLPYFVMFMILALMLRKKNNAPGTEKK